MIGPKQISALSLSLSYCINIHWAAYELVPFQFKIYTLIFPSTRLMRNSSKPEGRSESLGSASAQVSFQFYISAGGTHTQLRNLGFISVYFILSAHKFVRHLSY